MRAFSVLSLVSILALAGCSGGGKTPDQVAGTWGADCSSPFVKFSGDTIHVYPDDEDYDIKSSNLNGDTFIVSYDSKAGPVTANYVIENGMLRLDKGTYAGVEAVWHKQPMKKCD